MLRRGQIWWADFGEPRGSQPGFYRPVLVLQRDEVNASNLPTVVVCALTSNKAYALAPGNMLLTKRQTGLPKDSVVNASQIATLNRTDLEELLVTLPASLLTRIDEGIRWFLRLEQSLLGPHRISMFLEIGKAWLTSYLHFCRHGRRPQ